MRSTGERERGKEGVTAMGICMAPGQGCSLLLLLLVLCLLTPATLAQYFLPDPRFNSSSAVSYNVVKAEVGWWQANLHRNHGNGRLALLSPALRQFMLAEPDRFSEWHWIGALRLPTRWKWLDDSDLLVPRGHIRTVGLPVNHTLASWSEPFTCLLFCHSRFVAVQGILCYCLDSLPTDRLVAPTYTCPTDIYCVGDDSGASVYENTIKPGFLWWMDPKGAEAVSGLWAFLSGVSSSGSLEMQASSSHDEDKYYVCETAPGSRMSSRRFQCSGQLCAYNGGSRRQWDEAQSRCSLYANTRLASLVANDSSHLTDIVKSWRDYWVGLSRSLVWRNVDGTYMTESQVAETYAPRMCLAVKVQPYGFGEHAVYTMPSDCSVFLPFILETVPSPTTTSPPSTTAPPSPSPPTHTPPLPTPPIPDSSGSTPAPTASPTPTSSEGGNLSATDSFITKAPDAVVGSADTVGLGVGLAVGLLALIAVVVLFIFFIKRRGLLEKFKHKNQGKPGDFGERPTSRPAGHRLSNLSVTSSHPILDSAGSFADLVHSPAPPQYSLAEEFNGAYYNSDDVNGDVKGDAQPHYAEPQEEESDVSFDDDEFDSGPVYADVDGDDVNEAATAATTAAAVGGKVSNNARTAANYFVLEPEAVYENSEEPIYDVTPDEVYELEKVTPAAADVNADASAPTSRQGPNSAEKDTCPPTYSLATALSEDDAYEPTAAGDYVNQSELGLTSEPPALPPRNDSSKALSTEEEDLYENFISPEFALQPASSSQLKQPQSQGHTPPSRQAPRRDVNGYDVTRAPVGVAANPHMYSRLGTLTADGEDKAYDHTASASVHPPAVVPAYEEVAIADPGDDSNYSHLSDPGFSTA